MSLVLTVFLPNKTRYKFEISKFSPLYQGLEKVCTDKGYLPAQNFTFRYNKTYPDLGTPVGMLNLSSLVELELVPASEAPPARQAGMDAVSVALQFGSQRHTETCDCDTSLWDMICEFARKYPDWIPDLSPEQPSQSGIQVEHPVLIYMRQEIPGEAALRGTSPRQLGILPGGPAVLLRLVRRPVPPERLQAAAAAVEALRRKQATTPAAVAEAAVTTPAIAVAPVATVSSAIGAAESTATVGQPQSSAVAETAFTAAASSLFSPFREVPREPPAQPTRPQSREPRTLAEALNLPSFEDFRPAPNYHNEQPAAAPAFGPDRPFRFPQETAGRDLYRNELSELRPAEFAPCERRLCAYLAGGGAEQKQQPAAAADARLQLEEPDDSFFNLTESDMRRMMADLKRKVDEELNGPLLTRQQRDLRRDDLYATYEYSVVRLFFPDRHVVQATFRPRETVFTLCKFVRADLLCDAQADFFLYTTPPKKEISDMAQFLIHADLVPMPIVYVGFRSPVAEGQTILKPEVLALVGSREDCDKVALACMRSAVEPLYAKQQQQQRQAKEQARPSGGAASSEAGTSSAVPKWFKK